MEKVQDKNPNNSRVFIDYRKDKDKVRFERVGTSNNFKIALSTLFGFTFRGFGILIFIIPLMVLINFLNNIPINNFFYRTISSLVLIDFFIIYFIGGAFILSKTELIKYLPKLNTIGTKCYHINLESKDIKRNLFEIPLFNNVKLTYQAKGDVGEQLEKIEITEHPFNHRLRDKKGKLFKYPQEYLWKAKFFFKNKPLNGNLDIFFC